MTGFANRYWRSLVDTRTPSSARVARRGWDGYGFWKRYWASLLDVPLEAPRPGQEELEPDPGPARRRVRPQAQHDPESGRFRLPLPPRRGVVTAAGSGGVVLRVSGPDRLELLLHRIDGREADAQRSDYRLEVISPETADLPVVLSVWYRRLGDDTEQEILIPLTRAPLGPASSVIGLAGYDPEAGWQISRPVSAGRIPAWNLDTARTSVAAAASQATLNAWRDVADQVDERARTMILGYMP
ncbi:hypothetical protein ACBR40_07610 [Nonomuraea sp. AD125B]|uniref:hypothetical protein n=1 Tax=Nonomuraea TaxID=83681 RepID=UPI0031D3FE69